MPFAAPRPCTHPGCSTLVRDGSGRCEKHKRVERQQLDERRGTAHERGYTSAWQKARAAYLKRHPLCAEHAKTHHVVAATVVDHKVPHRLKAAMDGGDTDLIAKAKALFWDSENWQPLCKTCHDRKTATEDSAFARRRG